MNCKAEFLRCRDDMLAIDGIDASSYLAKAKARAARIAKEAIDAGCLSLELPETAEGQTIWPSEFPIDRQTDLWALAWGMICQSVASSSEPTGGALQERNAGDGVAVLVYVESNERLAAREHARVCERLAELVEDGEPVGKEKRLTVNMATDSVTLDSKEFCNLSGDAMILLNAVCQASGEYVAGNKLGIRPNRVIDKLPADLQAVFVDESREKGYRISREYC